MNKDTSRPAPHGPEVEVLLAILSGKNSNCEKARANVPAALEQLNKSERGRQALADFRLLIANGGYSLDSENWEALAMICRAEGYLAEA